MNLTSLARLAGRASACWLLVLGATSASQLGCGDPAPSEQESVAQDAEDSEGDDEVQPAAGPRDAGTRASPPPVRDAGTPAAVAVERDAGRRPSSASAPVDAGTVASPVDPLGELLGGFDLDAIFGPDAGWGAPPGPPAADNPKECPPVAPDNPIGSCIGVPVYATCNYGSYSCLCDWVHWLCI